jgi:oxygen-independent coproporphyrinogen-3 oxidase
LHNCKNAPEITHVAGIYLHIPFCKQACAYCNFHFTTSLRFKPELVDALVQEAVQEARYLSEPVSTIYFGGGTPSLLSLEELSRILDTIHQHYMVSPGAEITLEANPDDINAATLQGWKEAGINRLSIGVQSFREEELRWMNRAHTAEEAINCLQLAVAAFDNITLDLIYGSPLLSDEEWKNQVDIATGLGIKHLSCYALTVEEKTPLQKQIALRQKAPVDPDRQARQFLLLLQWLREKGYEHYEVSNFARPGYRSRHNTAYWQGTPYLGLGPSAHSFNGRERRWNIANNNRYVAGIREGKPSRETEVLTPVEQLNETIMIALRAREGLDLGRIRAGWGEEEVTRILQDLTPYFNSGLALLKNEQVALTDEGMLMADGIASALFTSETESR